MVPEIQLDTVWIQLDTILIQLGTVGYHFKLRWWMETFKTPLVIWFLRNPEQYWVEGS